MPEDKIDLAYLYNPDTWPEPTDPEPNEDQLEEWFFDSVCDATDGCTVEHDGICPHGHVSWFLYLHII